MEAKTAALHPNTDALHEWIPKLEDHTDVFELHRAWFEAQAVEFEAHEVAIDTPATPLAMLEEYVEAFEEKTTTEFSADRAFVTAMAEGGMFEVPPSSPTLWTIPRYVPACIAGT